MDNQLKYKVGDRVFHREFGLGTVRSIVSQVLPQYAVEFDEEFDGAYDCDGLCDSERSLCVYEWNLLKLDSLLSYLLHDMKEKFRSVKRGWNILTLWGKIIYVIAFVLCILLIMFETLMNKYERVIDKGIYKVIHIFRIHKE